MSKTCTDHLGNEFRSLKDMCGKYGLGAKLFCSRIKMGWTLEEALTTPIGESLHRGRRCCDHEGREFPSISAMAQAYGISLSLLERRLTKGMSLEESLTTPVMGWNRPVTDCFGQTFASVSAAARFYGLNTAALAYELRKGTSCAEVSRQLTGGSQDANITDHRGQIFQSLKDMAEHW